MNELFSTVCFSRLIFASVLSEFKSYAVVELDSVHLFVDSGKLTPSVRDHLAVENCQRGAECVM